MNVNQEEFIYPIVGRSRIWTSLYKRNKTMFFALFILLFMGSFIFVYRGFAALLFRENFFELGKLDLLYAIAALIGALLGALITYKRN